MLDDIRQQVARDGFARAPAPDMRRMVGEAALADWPAYARSWNDLAVDQYMADNGRYRRRRFATLEARPGEIVRQPHQPHFQSLAYNRLNGGVERWFEPITEAVVGLPLSRPAVLIGLLLLLVQQVGILQVTVLVEADAPFGHGTVA